MRLAQSALGTVKIRSLLSSLPASCGWGWGVLRSFATILPKLPGEPGVALRAGRPESLREAVTIRLDLGRSSEDARVLPATRSLEARRVDMASVHAAELLLFNLREGSEKRTPY